MVPLVLLGLPHHHEHARAPLFIQQVDEGRTDHSVSPWVCGPQLNSCPTKRNNCCCK